LPRLNPLYYARIGVSQGLSANQSYRNMQENAAGLSAETGDNWTGVARGTFLQIYSGISQARDQITAAMGAPKDLPGGGLDIPERPATVASGYLHAGVAFTRPIGAGDVEQTIHLVRSNDLLTPQQVEDAIRAQIEASAEDLHGTFARYTIEGISFTGVEKLVRTGGV
jgi:hypothetical protein